MDNVQVRTAEQLEKKYNLSKLSKNVANMEMTKNDIVKIEKELDDFIAATTGELENLEEQIDGKVDTYYYNGVPSLLNYPANSWDIEEYSNHIGDLYFDKQTGYTYRFENDSGYKWTRIKDSQITEAMASANAAQDTADGKRRIFMSQPTPPYDNGDLWLQYNNGNPGDIKACQISKAQGQSFNSNDWINASKYTDDTKASAIVDEMGGITTQVLSGQVVTIMQNYAKFTDLSTGGSTTIAGENITTGNIKSSNYVAGTSGTNLALSSGIITTPKVKIDGDGIKLSSNAKVIGGDGILTNFQFDASPVCSGRYGNYGIIGFEPNSDFTGAIATYLMINVNIPSNFKVSRAYLVLKHHPIKWYSSNGQNTQLGKCQNMKMYKLTSEAYTPEVSFFGEIVIPSTNFTLSNAINGVSFTANATTASQYKTEIYTSSDISTSNFSNGMNTFIIKTSNSIPSYQPEYMYRDLGQYNGFLQGQLVVEGYMSS